MKRGLHTRKCKICKQLIVGMTETHADFQLINHILKHKGTKKVLATLLKNDEIKKNDGEKRK